MVPKKRRRRHHLPRLNDPPLRNQAESHCRPSAVPILENDLRGAVVGVLQVTHNATEAAFQTSRALCDDARNARIKRSSTVRRPFPPGYPELFAGESSHDEGVLSGTSDVWTQRGACVFPSVSRKAVPRQYPRRSDEVNSREEAAQFQLKESAYSDAAVLDHYHLPSNNVAHDAANTPSKTAALGRPEAHVDFDVAPFYDCLDGVLTAVENHDHSIMGIKVDETEAHVDFDEARFYDCADEVPTAVPEQTHVHGIMGIKVEKTEVHVNVDEARFYDCVDEFPTAVPEQTHVHGIMGITDATSPHDTDIPRVAQDRTGFQRQNENLHAKNAVSTLDAHLKRVAFLVSRAQCRIDDPRVSHYHPTPMTGGGSGGATGNIADDGPSCIHVELLPDPPTVPAAFTQRCILTSLGRFINSMEQLPLSRTSSHATQYRDRHFAWYANSCHVHAMLESLFAVIDNSPSLFSHNTSPLLRAIHLCYVKSMAGVALCDVSDYFRAFFNGRAEGDQYSYLHGYGRPGLFGSYIAEISAVFDGHDRSEHFRITRTYVHSCGGCGSNKRVITTEPAIISLCDARLHYTPQEAINANVSYCRNKSPVYCDSCQQRMPRTGETRTTPSVLCFDAGAGDNSTMALPFELHYTGSDDVFDLVSVVYGNGSHFWGVHKRLTSDGPGLTWVHVDDMEPPSTPRREFTVHSRKTPSQSRSLHAMIYTRRRTTPSVVKTPLSSISGSSQLGYCSPSHFTSSFSTNRNLVLNLRSSLDCVVHLTPNMSNMGD